jgi:hypothetical protein
VLVHAPARVVDALRNQAVPLAQRMVLPLPCRAPCEPTVGCFGGPGEIRTHDLFHAMVSISIAYKVSTWKTKDLQDGDLDLIWTPGALPRGSGPQKVQLSTVMVAVASRTPGTWHSTCFAHARDRVRLASSSYRTKKRVALYSRSPWSPSSQSSLWLTRGLTDQGGTDSISERRQLVEKRGHRPRFPSYCRVMNW